MSYMLSPYVLEERDKLFEVCHGFRAMKQARRSFGTGPWIITELGHLLRTDGKFSCSCDLIITRLEANDNNSESTLLLTSLSSASVGAPASLAASGDR